MVNIGFEIEYSKYNLQNILQEIDSNFLSLYNIQFEYYTNQIEFNRYLRKNVKFTIKSIAKELYRIKKVIFNLAKKIPDNNTIIHNDIFYSNKSLIFNGLHFHFSLSRSIYSSNLTYANEFIIWHKLTKNFTLRSLISHHVAGGKRSSAFDFKQKSKYCPIIISAIGTVEFRIFDILDIMNQNRCYQTAKVIYTCLKMLYFNEFPPELNQNKDYYYNLNLVKDYLRMPSDYNLKYIKNFLTEYKLKPKDFKFVWDYRDDNIYKICLICKQILPNKIRNKQVIFFDYYENN